MSETSGKVGAPSIKTDELLVSLCDLLSSGNTLRSICLEPDMPSLSTVMRWLREDEQFRQQYARARQEQADYFADEIIDLADEAKDGHSSAAAKVKIDARIWHASKTNKGKYGDKGTDINISNTVVTLTQADQVQLQERRKKAEAQLLLQDSKEAAS